MDKYRRVRLLGKGSYGAATLVTLATDPSKKYVVVRASLDPRRVPGSARGVPGALFTKGRAAGRSKKSTRIDRERSEPDPAVLERAVTLVSRFDSSNAST